MNQTKQSLVFQKAIQREGCTCLQQSEEVGGVRDFGFVTIFFYLKQLSVGLNAGQQVVISGKNKKRRKTKTQTNITVNQ